jgi:hypothetical protein
MPLAYIAIVLNSLFVLGFVAFLFIDSEFLFSFLFITFWQIDMPYVYVFSLTVLLSVIVGLVIFFFYKKNLGKILLNVANGLAMLLCVLGALGLVVTFGMFWAHLSVYLVLYVAFGGSLALINLDNQTFIRAED